MSKLSGLKRNLREAFSVGREYGPRFFAVSLLWGVIPRSLPVWKKLDLRYCRLMKEWLRGNLLPEIAPLIPAPGFDTPIGEDAPIWVMWWQGLENAPPIAERCYRRLLANAGGHPVRLITKENYREWIDVPETLEKRIAEGSIPPVKISDCLRFALLRQRGGLYLDMTLLLTHPLPEEIFRLSYFTMRHEQGADWLIGKGRWVIGVQGAAPGNPLMVYMDEVHTRFWRDHGTDIGYSMADAALQLAYEALPAVAEQLDQVPVNNRGTFDLLERLNEPEDPEWLARLCRENDLLRLTWRLDLPEREDTNFAAVLRGGEEK